MPALLEARALRAGYGARTVIHDVGLHVPARTVVALLGRNGTGKTTLLRTIAGTTEARGGRITFDGRDLTHAPPDERARAGLRLVPEGGVFSGLTVRENLELAGGVDEALATFPPLAARADRPARTLSGGERQMLALGAALATAPKLICLDELTLGLAPIVADQLFELVAALPGRGTAVLLVEQHVPRAIEVADLVYVLDRGTIAFAGEPEELRSDPVLMRSYLGVVGVPGETT